VTRLLPFNTLFAVLIAAIEIGFEAGSVAGAVYNPVLVIRPTLVFPPAIPFTAQVTFWLIGTPPVPLPVTVAVNCWVAPTRRLALAGVTFTPWFGVGLDPLLLLGTAPHPVHSATAIHNPTLDKAIRFRLPAILNIGRPLCSKLPSTCAREKVEQTLLNRTGAKREPANPRVRTSD
jgi:hypothetical protein